MSVHRCEKWSFTTKQYFFRALLAWNLFCLSHGYLLDDHMISIIQSCWKFQLRSFQNRPESTTHICFCLTPIFRVLSRSRRPVGEGRSFASALLHTKSLQFSFAPSGLCDYCNSYQDLHRAFILEFPFTLVHIRSVLKLLILADMDKTNANCFDKREMVDQSNILNSSFVQRCRLLTSSATSQRHFPSCRILGR